MTNFMSSKLNLVIVSCSLFVILVLVYVNTSHLTSNKVKKNRPEKAEGSQKHHFQFDIPVWQPGWTCAFRDNRTVCKHCLTKPELWDCVGEDRIWGMVFVDNRPGAKRGPNALRLVERAEIIVTHDTNQNDALWPKDWINTRKTDSPIWAGRRVFTDKRGPWTSVIQGDMDKTGAVFDKVVSAFSSGEITPYWDQFNPTHSGWGSHVRLLTAAALSTTGDILELGTGFFSTPLLHQIVKEEGGRRMIVSSDTDSNWLPLFRNLTTTFHQILLVPVYQDGGTCGGYPGETRQVLPPQDLEFAGVVTKGLETNQNINCPRRRKKHTDE